MKDSPTKTIKTALIFGSNGQDGFYLQQLLKREHVEAIATSRSLGQDVSDLSQVEKLISDHQPDYIFHFAATSTTRHEALFENHQSIATGTLNILESARRFAPGARIFLSGSAMQFKNTGTPINEQTPFEASSPYSVSRIQSTYSGRYYREKFGLKVYVGYLFNHESPGRSEQHVNMKIVAALKAQKELLLGDIDVKKEFNFAGDMVEAMWILVNQDQVFEAVLGCGQSHSIREWLDYCSKKLGVDPDQLVKMKKDYVPEYRNLVSDPKLIRSLGWKPVYSMTQLADLILNESAEPENR